MKPDFLFKSLNRAQDEICSTTRISTVSLKFKARDIQLRGTQAKEKIIRTKNAKDKKILKQKETKNITESLSSSLVSERKGRGSNASCLYCSEKYFKSISGEGWVGKPFYFRCIFGVYVVAQLNFVTPLLFPYINLYNVGMFFRRIYYSVNINENEYIKIPYKTCKHQSLRVKN